MSRRGLRNISPSTRRGITSSALLSALGWTQGLSCLDWWPRFISSILGLAYPTKATMEAKIDDTHTALLIASLRG